METRSLDPADIERSFEIRARSFGPLPESVQAQADADVLQAIAERRMIAVYDGSRLVGRALIRDFRQWWGGRSLRMAGVAGVVVAPEFRGRGVGTALVQGVVARSRELGYPLSVLYPATVPVYRRQGWEVVGVQHRVTMDATHLRALRGGDVAVREAAPDDASALLEMMRHQYDDAAASGPKDYTEAEIREGLGDSSAFAYLAEGGFVRYRWAGTDLEVQQLQAATPETARALWAVVGSGSSVAKTVHAYQPPDDPIHHLLGEAVAAQSVQNRWMLRLIDPAAAIAGRGFPREVQIDVPLILDDPGQPSQSVSGRLSVADGKGELVPGSAESGSVRLGPNGLAALYAGASGWSLRAAGLVSGGSTAQYDALTAAFACRPAYLLDYF